MNGQTMRGEPVLSLHGRRAAITDLIGGQDDGLRRRRDGNSHLKNNKLRGGDLERRRSPQLPDLPSFEDLGSVFRRRVVICIAGPPSAADIVIR